RRDRGRDRPACRSPCPLLVPWGGGMRLVPSLLIPLAAVVAGCSSGGAGNPTVPTIAPAKVYRLGGFQPAGVTQPGRPVTLTFSIRVAGAYHPKPLPPFASDVTVDGYRFVLHELPTLHVAQAALVKVTVTDPSGRPATFTPWYGALAHAIFFHEGNLAYFHTHVCAPGLAGCTSIVGGTPVSGSSTKPGLLNVGVLVPESGTWRLFLQCQVN